MGKTGYPPTVGISLGKCNHDKYISAISPNPLVCAALAAFPDDRSADLNYVDCPLPAYIIRGCDECSRRNGSWMYCSDDKTVSCIGWNLPDGVEICNDGDGPFWLVPSGVVMPRNINDSDCVQKPAPIRVPTPLSEEASTPPLRAPNATDAQEPLVVTPVSVSDEAVGVATSICLGPLGSPRPHNSRKQPCPKRAEPLPPKPKLKRQVATASGTYEPEVAPSASKKGKKTKKEVVDLTCEEELEDEVIDLTGETSD